MAIYHCSVKIISRSSGRTAVAAAAYRSSEKIYCAWDGMTYDYTKKRHTQHKEILLPENAPQAYHNRADLWNAVEAAEQRKDARTAREIELAIPHELDSPEQIKLVRDYVQGSFVEQGMCADVAIHDKGDGNPHAHVMLTTRSVSTSGFGPKNRSWNDRQNVEVWREAWATHCNQAFARQGLALKVDHRSYVRQGIDRIPTIHLGVAAANMEKKGIATEKGLINQAIRKRNMSYDQELAELKAELKQLQDTISLEAAAPSSHRDLIKEYLNLELEINSHKTQADKLQNQVRVLGGKLEDLGERREIISSFQDKILQLNIQLRALPPLALGERALFAGQLERLDRSLQQSRASLERDYKIPLGEIDALELKLQEQLEQIKQDQARLPVLDPLRERQQAIEQKINQEHLTQTSQALKEVSLNQYVGMDKITVARASQRLLQQVADHSLEQTRHREHSQAIER